MRTFICGPMDGDYKKRFSEAECYLSEIGLTPVNPNRVLDPLPPDTPYGCCMDIVLSLVKHCDAIYVLEGWRDSEDALAEYYCAKKNNLKIMFEDWEESPDEDDNPECGIPFLDADETKDDNVNHPAHYTKTSIECIDAMIETQGVAAVTSFCVCNAFKYLWRHNEKNGDEDIRKANWYLNKAVTLLDKR